MAVKRQKIKAARSRAKRPSAVARRVKTAAPAALVPAAPVTPVGPRTSNPAGHEGDTTQFIRRESMRYDGDTAIKLYLREIGQVKLLTPQEEIVLAGRNTGAVVSAAAVIMVAALCGLVFGRVAGLQELGVGLSTGYSSTSRSFADCCCRA